MLPDLSRRLFLGMAWMPPTFSRVQAPNVYPHHLQGVCTDERDTLYWSFTDRLLKTDARAKVLKEVAGPNHLGDLCYHGGKLYVAVNLGLFNDPGKRADSWVYVYDAGDLSLLARHKTPELVYGAGGIATHDGRFMVVGGLPEGFEENYVYEYGGDFRFRQRHVLRSGYTLMGIQTAAFSDGQWWFGCYGKPAVLLRASADLKRVERFEFDCSYGIVPIAARTFLVAASSCSRCQTELFVADAHPAQGLALRG